MTEHFRTRLLVQVHQHVANAPPLDRSLCALRLWRIFTAARWRIFTAARWRHVVAVHFISLLSLRTLSVFAAPFFCSLALQRATASVEQRSVKPNCFLHHPRKRLQQRIKDIVLCVALRARPHEKRVRAWRSRVKRFEHLHGARLFGSVRSATDNGSKRFAQWCSALLA